MFPTTHKEVMFKYVCRKTALHYASILNNKECTKILIEAGADANSQDNGR